MMLRKRDGRGMYVWGQREVHTGFWWGDLREGDHLRDPSVDARIILKWTFQDVGWGHGLD
jgi:hypothetical protein